MRQLLDDSGLTMQRTTGLCPRVEVRDKVTVRDLVVEQVGYGLESSNMGRRPVATSCYCFQQGGNGFKGVAIPLFKYGQHKFGDSTKISGLGLGIGLGLGFKQVPVCRWLGSECVPTCGYERVPIRYACLKSHN